MLGQEFPCHVFILAVVFGLQDVPLLVHPRLHLRHLKEVLLCLQVELQLPVPLTGLGLQVLPSLLKLLTPLLDLKTEKGLTLKTLSSTT